MSNLFKKTLAVVKKAAKSVVGYFTRNSSPAVQAYAQEMASDLIEAAPKAFVAAQSLYGRARNFGLNAETAEMVLDVAMGGENPLKEVLSAPARLLHGYRNFQAVRGEQPVVFDADELLGKGFVAINRRG